MCCRVCSQHGQALLALNIYDWMSTRVAEGGAGLRPTVFTYTAAMRAALAGNLIDRALKVCTYDFVPDPRFWDRVSLSKSPHFERLAAVAVAPILEPSFTEAITCQNKMRLCHVYAELGSLDSRNSYASVTQVSTLLYVCRYGTMQWLQAASQTAACAPRCWRCAHARATQPER